MKSINRTNWRLNRRDALGLLGALGAGMAVGCGDDHGQAAAAGGSLADAASTNLVDALGVDARSLSCILTPSLDQGPFFVDENLLRSDLLAAETDPGITRGTPLLIQFGIYAVTGASCIPLTGAHVDIWHADVDGLYSDTPSGFVQATDTTGKKYLRGYQVVGNDGTVTFKTIYPGWYFTRTIHVHVKIRLYSAAGDTTLEATTQLFFDDVITDAVFAQDMAYLAHGMRSVPKNTDDQIYNGTGPGSAIDLVGPPPGQARPGEMTTVAPVQTSIDGKPGYSTAFKIGVQMG